MITLLLDAQHLEPRSRSRHELYTGYHTGTSAPLIASCKLWGNRHKKFIHQSLRHEAPEQNGAAFAADDESLLGLQPRQTLAPGEDVFKFRGGMKRVVIIETLRGRVAIHKPR